MFVSDVCHLTIKEYTIVKIMQELPFGNNDLMRSIVGRKLSNVIVMLEDQIPTTVVTLGSRVTYRIDDGPAEALVVVSDDFREPLGLLPAIAINHPKALAMLGLSVGASAILRPQKGKSERITVLEVVNPPEAARDAHVQWRMGEPIHRMPPRVPARLENAKRIQPAAFNPKALHGAEYPERCAP